MMPFIQFELKAGVKSWGVTDVSSGASSLSSPTDRMTSHQGAFGSPGKDSSSYKKLCRLAQCHDIYEVGSEADACMHHHK